jgi:O-antigen ligase
MRVVPFLATLTLAGLVVYTGFALAMEETLDHLFQLSVGPASVYLSDLLLLAAIALLIRESLTPTGLRMPARNRTVVFLVLGYCAYQLAVVLPVSVLFYDLEPVGVIRQLGWRLSLILIPFVYLVGLKYVTARRLVLWLNIAAAVLAAYAIYRYATGASTSHANDVGVVRLRTLWGGASLLFGFLILTSLFLLKGSVWSYAGALMGVIGLVLTNHRSGFLALLAVIIPLLLHFRRASGRITVVVLVGLTVVVMLFAVSSTVRTSTLYSLDTMLNPSADINTRDRLERSQLGWEYFLAHPLGDYTWSQQYYLVDLGPDNSFEPHNFVIQLLGQQGIVGFVFFIAIIATTARIAWRNRAADRLSAVLLAYFAFYWIFCLFNTEYINQWNILLMAAPAGMILARNATIVAVTELELEESGVDENWAFEDVSSLATR